MNYANPTQLQAAILDWAGTVVDFGSFAPTQIFVEAFAEFDVQVSIEEARGPMGMGKWDHIRTLCDQPQVAERYRKAFGRTPTDDDVTAIYKRFMPLQIEKIAEHSALIPGALATIANLRQQGIKIGSCSGAKRANPGHAVLRPVSDPGVTGACADGTYPVTAIKIDRRQTRPLSYGLYRKNPVINS